MQSAPKRAGQRFGSCLEYDRFHRIAQSGSSHGMRIEQWEEEERRLEEENEKLLLVTTGRKSQSLPSG